MRKNKLGKHFIRQWREYRGLSLRKLAERMEIEPSVPLTSHAIIGRIETYKQPYTQEIIEALAVALNVTVVDLLTRDPNKEGDVVDLVNLIKEKDREQAIRILKALSST